MILYETVSPESPIHALVSISGKTCTFTLSKQWDWEKAQLEVIPALKAIRDSDQWSKLAVDFRELSFEERTMGTAFISVMGRLLKLADQNCAMISIQFRDRDQCKAVYFCRSARLLLFCLEFENDPVELPELAIDVFVPVGTAPVDTTLLYD